MSILCYRSSIFILFASTYTTKEITQVENHPFIPGKDWVYYSRAIFGTRETSAVIMALNEDWLGCGKYSILLEEKISKIFGQNGGRFVNSGSSANWIGIKVLNLPLGGEVVTPACTFSTTLNPIIQFGLTPVFVDVDLDTYNVNLDLVEAAIGPKTVALM